MHKGSNYEIRGASSFLGWESMILYIVLARSWPHILIMTTPPLATTSIVDQHRARCDPARARQAGKGGQG